MTVLAFDVNETLLDLRALDAPFAAAFGDASLRPLWFSIMLQVAFVGGLTGSYTDFTTAQRSALAILAKRQKVTLSTEQSDAIVDRMRSLPPHPEVRAAMERLRAKFRLVAAHGWDIAGALAAGCRAAFVARPGAVIYPHGAQPDVIGADLRAVAEALLR